MKTAAIILCSIQIIAFFVMFAVERRMPEGWALALVALIFVCPLVSVWALIAGKSEGILTGEESLFSLWIQKKKLEQKARIKELKGS